jgi:hypothetical protein
MWPPSASDLLAAWERGVHQPPLERTRTLLLLAVPDGGDPSGLSAGAADGYLLDLRRYGFGSRVVAVADCPGCAEPAELDFDLSAIQVLPAVERPETLVMNVSAYRIHVRVPTLADLSATAHLPDPESIRRALLELTVTATRRGRTVAPAGLPADVLKTIEARLGDADPQADVRLGVRCPHCAHEWAAPFDIARFLWAELDAWAVRLLFEVHVLASAYSWSEPEVLALSPARRRFYLEAVGA